MLTFWNQFVLQVRTKGQNTKYFHKMKHLEKFGIGNSLMENNITFHWNKLIPHAKDIIIFFGSTFQNWHFKIATTPTVKGLISKYQFSIMFIQKFQKFSWNWIQMKFYMGKFCNWKSWTSTVQWQEKLAKTFSYSCGGVRKQRNWSTSDALGG